MKFIQDLEGSYRNRYLKYDCIPAIGSGHVLTHAEMTSGKIPISRVITRYRGGLSKALIDAMLQDDINRVLECTAIHVHVGLSENEWTALTSFVYDIGCTAFVSSTLLKKLNDHEWAEIPNEMRRWVTYNGVKVPGMIKRREKEIKKWLS